MRLSEVATATGGALHGPDVEIDGVTLDSRALHGGQLFVAVRAERDGHDFVASAVTAGAAATLVDHAVDGAGSQVVVDDTVDALRRLGTAARGRLRGPLIAVTGSVGKTSTKDLMAAICAEAGVVSASEKSLNNELGVPLTLLNALEGTERTIVEMGARGHGHIRLLCSIASPTIGLVTTVSAAHTEYFGTIEEVGTAKSELVAALPVWGTAVLNAEVELVANMASVTDADVLLFGDDGEVYAERIVLDEFLRASFELHSPWGVAQVRLGVSGGHNVTNALGAAAATLAAGVSLDDVVEGLGRAELSPWRMELLVAPSGVWVLNDAYNASPASMLSAIESLGQLEARRRIAVLGAMAELGERSDAEHRAVREVAASLGIEVIAVGTTSYGDVEVVGLDEVVQRLGPLGPHDAVLLKGSRVAGLEVVAEELVSR